VWQKLQAQASSIIVNLDQVVSEARQDDPNVRIATVDYPYVMNAGNVCEGDYTLGAKGGPVFQHGAASVINFLDALYSQINGSQLALVDLRSVFGTTNPLFYIQTLSDYGYPHPNPSGEQAIATAVADAISSL
jgi:lysophospholipase L1-like esterase